MKETEYYCFQTLHIAFLIFLLSPEGDQTFGAAHSGICCINSYSSLAFITLRHQIKTKRSVFYSFLFLHFKDAHALHSFCLTDLWGMH